MALAPARVGRDRERAMHRYPLVDADYIDICRGVRV